MDRTHAIAAGVASIMMDATAVTTVVPIAGVRVRGAQSVGNKFFRVDVTVTGST